ncbi:uncharacterized protein LOC143253353 isoform X5 [Tachypleus tridentatus]|uniref:uncharacterized protein LOC143253353 isoform X5 n=1 Tax=Tachypleus tridentatus TaxID=6853 RepID=UPI003FCEEE0A
MQSYKEQKIIIIRMHLFTSWRICCKGFAYYSQQRGYDLPTPSKISGIRAVQLHWWISWNMAWYLTGKHIGYNH